MIVRAKWSALPKVAGTNTRCVSRSVDWQPSWPERLLSFWPRIRGAVLAFPAIFCASATLIEKHECELKETRGLGGCHRGIDAAALDAAGAGLGSIGLVAFGLTVWLLVPDWSFAAVALGSLGWILVSVFLWRVDVKCAWSSRSAPQTSRACRGLVGPVRS